MNVLHTSYFVLKNTMTSCLLTMGLLFSPHIYAELLTVILQGAKSPVYFDLDKGVMFIGDDCSPFLKFKEKPVSRKKLIDSREFTISSAKNRGSNKSSIQSRLPNAIEVSGDELKIVSRSVTGISFAKGRIVRNASALQNRSLNCK